METMNDRKFDAFKFLKNFFLFFIILGFGSFLVFYLSNQILLKEKITLLIDEKKQMVQAVAENTGNDLNQAIDLLVYLKDRDEGLLEKGDFDVVAQDWLLVAKDFQLFDQIRYLDKNGDEVIRINFNDQGAEIESQQNLQNKKDRYYFTETLKLPDGNIYISPLDLNIEKGEIELPYKPMIRLAMPVYGSDGQLDGMLILNYLAKYMIKDIEKVRQTDEDKLYLVNQDGYWLSSINQEEEWGFMFEDRKLSRFDLQFPDEWLRIKGGETSFLSRNGLFTVATPLLAEELSSRPHSFLTSQLHLAEGKWLIVSIATSDGTKRVLFQPKLFDFFQTNFLFFLLFYLALAILSLASALLVTYRQVMAQTLKYFSERDPLTNVFNRKAGLEKLRNYISVENRRKTNIAICYTDINGLKQVNDTLGHKSGDDLIGSYVAVLQEVIREGDYIVRLGGDEFIIVLNNADAHIAELIWTRIKAKMENLNNQPGRKYCISGSHGIATLEDNHNGNVDELLALADSRMYAEKRELKKNFHVLEKD